MEHVALVGLDLPTLDPCPQCLPRLPIHLLPAVPHASITSTMYCGSYLPAHPLYCSTCLPSLPWLVAFAVIRSSWFVSSLLLPGVLPWT